MCEMCTKACFAFTALRPVTSAGIKLSIKGRVCITVIGSETWSFRVENMQILSAFKHRYLCCIGKMAGEFSQ